MRRIVDQLAHAHAPHPNGITVDVAIDQVRLTVDSAVSCGLLISELVSNSFKHASPGTRGGRILVRFQTVAGGYEIEVRDDGVGLPAGFDPSTSESLGLELVRTLVRQLDGGLRASSSDGGTAFCIRLPPSVVRRS